MRVGLGIWPDTSEFRRLELEVLWYYDEPAVLLVQGLRIPALQR
jgi:hypothetical protein